MLFEILWVDYVIHNDALFYKTTTFCILEDTYRFNNGINIYILILK